METQFSLDLNDSMQVSESILPNGNQPLGVNAAGGSGKKKRRSILRSIRKKIGIAFEGLGVKDDLNSGDNFEKSMSFESLSTQSFLNNRSVINTSNSVVNYSGHISPSVLDGGSLLDESSTSQPTFQENPSIPQIDVENPHISYDLKSVDVLNPPTVSNLRHAYENCVTMEAQPSTKLFDSSVAQISSSPSIPISGNSSLLMADSYRDEQLDSKHNIERDKETEILVREIKALKAQGWYWGSLTRSEAEQRLSEQPNGTFLLRDSSDSNHLLSLSFKSSGKTLHTRIEQTNGRFSFHPQPENNEHTSLVALIDHCISRSYSGVFCYSRPLTKGALSFPVRLTQPLSRFDEPE